MTKVTGPEKTKRKETGNWGEEEEGIISQLGETKNICHDKKK